MILNYLYFLPSIKWPKRVERHFSWLVPQLSSTSRRIPLAAIWWKQELNRRILIFCPKYLKICKLIPLHLVWSPLARCFLSFFYAFQSWKQFYIHKCPLVCLSVHLEAKPLNSQKSTSFIIQPSSFIILHSSFIHPSFISRLLSFSACFYFDAHNPG